MRPRDYSIDAEMWDDLLVIAKRGDDVYKQGNFAAEQALKAREQQYGKKSVGLVEGLDKYAAWLRYSSQFGKERKTRKRSVKLLEREYGSRDYRIASQLRAITTGYIASGGDQEDAVDAIERALELFYPETAKAAYELGQVTAVWADVHVVYINPDLAPDIYAAAWTTFAANKQLGPDFANKYFAKPKRLYYSMPGRPVGRNGDNYFGRGYVVMQFNVEANGLVSEVDMVEVSAPDIDRKAFYRAYQNARYRPRVQNGEAIITVGEKLRNSYDWTN